MAFIGSSLWFAVWCVLLATLLWGAPSGHDDLDVDGERHNRVKKDHHGGVPMGNVAGCDDAKTGIEVDWNPQSRTESTCVGDILKPNKSHFYSHCENETSEPIHMCLSTPITYEDTPPTSGPHRPSWPDYGDYVYVPPQRWLHSLEHGAIVMLYHPCADPEEVGQLKQLVQSCLRRHVITPYPQLAEDTPLALLSWGCQLRMSHVVPDMAHTFIMNHAIRGPEGNVAARGNYKAGLLNASQVVSDYHDTHLCPHFRSPGNEQNLSDSTRTTAVQATNTMEAIKSNSEHHNTLGDNRQETSDKGKAASPEPVNPIIVQSSLRRHRLDEVTEKAQRNMDVLHKVYREFISKS